MNKDDCKHLGEYGFGDGYAGGKFCRLDGGCDDAVQCRKIFVNNNHGYDVITFINNVGKGEKFKAQEQRDAKDAQRIRDREAIDREKEREQGKVTDTSKEESESQSNVQEERSEEKE